MSGIDSFILGSLDEIDAIFGTVVMVADGQAFPVVIDDVSKSTSGEEIGLSAEYDLIACAQPAHVENPKALLNKRCTVDGITYRIGRVRAGTVAIHFMLNDTTK